MTLIRPGSAPWTRVGAVALDPAAAQDAAPLTLGGSAPHAVVDAVGERVLEALGLHRALRTDLAGPVDADAVGREELRRGQRTAVGLEHPLLFAVIGGRGQVVHAHPQCSVDEAVALSSTVGTGPGFP